MALGRPTCAGTHGRADANLSAHLLQLRAVFMLNLFAKLPPDAGATWLHFFWLLSGKDTFPAWLQLGARLVRFGFLLVHIYRLPEPRVWLRGCRSDIWGEISQDTRSFASHESFSGTLIEPVEDQTDLKPRHSSIPRATDKIQTAELSFLCFHR